jgi:antirestriction protein
MDLNQHTNALLNAACSSHSGGDVQGFFYIDGIPTKGIWVDLLPVRSWDDIKEQLETAFPDSVVDEILIADCEGHIARPFMTTSCDGFSMTEWADFAEALETTHLDIEVVEAYCSNFCYPSDIEIDKIEEAYAGQFDSDEDFATDMLEQCGDLDSIPEGLRYYFDYSAYARDLMYDYFEVNGYYFRNL